MAVYRRTTRPRFTLLLLVLTSLTAITLDYRSDAGGVIDSIKGGARDAFAPVQSAVSAATRPVRDIFEGVINYSDLEEENARLREQLDRQRGIVLRAQDAERERQDLADLNAITFLPDIDSIAARVVSTAPSSFELTVVIDKGTGEGVAKGMPVVTGAGLVGRVAQVSRRRAVVVLVTDPTSRVGVRLSTSGDVGVAEGDGPRRALPVDLVDAATPVRQGEVVVTSGLQNSIYPAGIPVGRVRTVGSATGPIRKGLTMAPVVDLRRLAFVKVLVWPQT